MFCDRCGKELEAASRFCNACGKPVGALVSATPEGRVSRHMNILGILWAATAALRILEVAWIFFVGRAFLPYMLSWLPSDRMGFPLGRFVHGILGAAAGFAVVWAIVAVLAAWGLLQHEPWGRTMALIAGALALIRIPLGTALGIYTLWVLLPQSSEEEYRRLARAM
jgi:zinc-ribbon domain